MAHDMDALWQSEFKESGTKLRLTEVIQTFKAIRATAHGETLAPLQRPRPH